MYLHLDARLLMLVIPRVAACVLYVLSDQCIISASDTNSTVAHGYEHAAEHKRHTDLLRGTYYLLRGTPTSCAEHPR